MLGVVSDNSLINLAQRFLTFHSPNLFAFLYGTFGTGPTLSYFSCLLTHPLLLSFSDLAKQPIAQVRVFFQGLTLEGTLYLGNAIPTRSHVSFFLTSLVG